MQRTLFTIASLFLSGYASIAHAGVINSADVAGLTTFEDTNTGRIWLDMNNFFDASATNGTTGFDMISIAQNTGFTFATATDVHQLLDSLPLTGGEWSSYAAIMGYGIPRGLIWGMYDDGNGDPFGYAWSFWYDQNWQYMNDSAYANTVENQGLPGQVDMGIWAYRDSQTIPEPATLGLLGLGLAGLGISRRRKGVGRVSAA